MNRKKVFSLRENIILFTIYKVFVLSTDIKDAKVKVLIRATRYAITECELIGWNSIAYSTISLMRAGVVVMHLVRTFNYPILFIIYRIYLFIYPFSIYEYYRIIYIYIGIHKSVIIKLDVDTKEPTIFVLTATRFPNPLAHDFGDRSRTPAQGLRLR